MTVQLNMRCINSIYLLRSNIEIEQRFPIPVMAEFVRRNVN